MDTAAELLAQVRSSRAPHEDDLAVALVRAHDRVRGQLVSGRLTLMKFVAPMAFAASVFFPPAFVALASASVVGGVVAVVRSSRRSQEVRQFSRHAQVTEARAVIADSHGDRDGDLALVIEIADGERVYTARIEPAWPRSPDVDLEHIPTLFAPHSTVVLCVGPHQKLFLGEIEQRPLPRATLQLRR